MSGGWQELPFDEVIEDVSGGNIKTPQGEYLTHGKFAVVDQGKALVAGYVDDESRLCRAASPVIVFGDHTRCFKYVDFPFCMGADGVKVLRPKIESDARYLYHYFSQLVIPNNGYDRHYKYLRRNTVTVPPVVEQRRIAEVLDRADALRAARREALAHLDTLIQSVFLDMFGDSVANPKGWSVKPFDFVMTDETSKSMKLPQSSFDKEGVYPVIDQGQSHIAGYCSDPSYLCTSELPTIVFGDHTRIVKFVDKPFVIGADGAKVLAPSHEVDARYLCWLLRMSPIPNLGYSRHMREIKRLRYMIPPFTLQQTFSRRITAIGVVKATHRTALAELNALFASLQHRAFRGEL